VQIIALIESAKGVEALEEIVSASVKPVCLLFGAADMAADLGATVEWEPLLWVRSRLVQAAALNGVALVDSPFFALTDPDGLKRETQSALKMGFHGKCAIHPAQLASLNAIMTPSAEEIAEARQVLIVNQQGVGSVNHKMVDEAFARQARVVLMRAGLPISE
jgi:(S)-citramalyl-CoA lyase